MFAIMNKEGLYFAGVKNDNHVFDKEGYLTYNRQQACEKEIAFYGLNAEIVEIIWIDFV